MKLNASTSDLKAVIARLANMPGAVTGSPITQAVRFEADADGLKLTRFSSEARISVTLEAASIEDDEGTFVVDHTALTKMVNHLPAKEVTLSNDEKKLSFVSGNAKSNLSIMQDMEADMPEAELETEHIRLPVEMLSMALEFVGMAMHSDESQGGFCGLCIRMIGEQLAFIATDRRWLHLQFFDYVLPVDVVIAAKTVEAILKAIGKQAGACTLSVGEQTVSLLSHDADMNFALLNASYPNVERMTVQDESSIRSKIEVCRADFVEALKTASGIADDLGRFVQITVTTTDMTLTATNEKDSEIALNLPCTASAPDKFILASVSVISSLALFDEHEQIDLILYPNSLFVRESNRIAVFALKAT